MIGRNFRSAFFSACILAHGLLFVAPAAVAATLRVDGNTGFDSAGCGGEGNPCESIQYAINGASSGDVILVAAGTYTYDAGLDPCLTDQTGVVCLQPASFKSLTITGGFSGGDWTTSTPETNLTIIDGENAKRGVMLDGSSDGAALVLEGFTVRNGLGLHRPGLDNNGFGGGISAVLADLTLRNVVIKDNVVRGADVDPGKGGAGAGGGLAIRSNGSSPRATLVMENVTFDNNQAVGGVGAEAGGYAHGGALFIYYTDASGSDIHVTNNQALAGDSIGDGIFNGRADAQGGGIAFKDASISTFTRVTATGNTALGGNAATSGGTAGGAFGGGLYGELATYYSIVDGVVRENVAHGGDAATAGMGFGGGVFSLDSEVSLDRVQVIENSAIGGDGATAKGSGGGGGTYFADNAGVAGGREITMLNTVIAGNDATLGSGGGSTSGGGGAVFLNGGQASLSHCTLSDNSLSNSPPMQGKSIVIITRPTATPVPSNMAFGYGIISNHDQTGDAAVHVKDTSSITFGTGIFSNNGVDTAGTGGFNGLVNMSSETSLDYVSGGAPDYDYRLTPPSPAVDAASGSSATLDFEGDSRDGEPDIGADELTDSLFLIFTDGFESGDTTAW